MLKKTIGAIAVCVVLAAIPLRTLRSPFSLQAEDRHALKISVEPESKILPEALQPFAFLSRQGTVVVQATLPTPEGTEWPGKWAYVRSTDGAKTWKPWASTRSDGASPYTEGNVTQLKDGTILIMEWVARGPKDGVFTGKLWESRDEWKTLTGPIEARVSLPQGKGGFDDGGNPVNGLFIHRTLMEMPNGNLLATAYGWFKEDSTPAPYMKNMNKFRCLLLESRDRGRNWSLVSTIAVDPTVGEEGFNEPVLVRLTQGEHKGRFIVLMRTGSNKAQWPNPLYQTESDDEGRSWTKPHPLPFDGVDPDLIEMKNGILVAGFGWRTRESRQAVAAGQPGHLGPEHGNYVAFSTDQGKTWSDVTRVTEEPTTAYVTLRELEPSKLLLVYDVGDWWGREWVGYPHGIERATAVRIIDVHAR